MVVAGSQVLMRVYFSSAGAGAIAAGSTVGGACAIHGSMRQHSSAELKEEKR
jgi:hypothetical protein